MTHEWTTGGVYRARSIQAHVIVVGAARIESRYVVVDVTETYGVGNHHAPHFHRVGRKRLPRPGMLESPGSEGRLQSDRARRIGQGVRPVRRVVVRECSGEARVCLEAQVARKVVAAVRVYRSAVPAIRKRGNADIR